LKWASTVNCALATMVNATETALESRRFAKRNPDTCSILILVSIVNSLTSERKFHWFTFFIKGWRSIRYLWNPDSSSYKNIDCCDVLKERAANVVKAGGNFIEG